MNNVFRASEFKRERSVCLAFKFDFDPYLAWKSHCCNQEPNHEKPLDGIDQVLAERGERYGAFDSHAEITQVLKDNMRLTDNWEALRYSQREALDMIAHKIGRVLNGDPDYIDNWTDIAGYALLVEREIKEMAHG